MNAPPIREPWKTDATGRLVSMPWILWLQQLATEIASAGSNPASVSAAEPGYAKKFLLMGG